jgi:hypothetical protein
MARVLLVLLLWACGLASGSAHAATTSTVLGTGSAFGFNYQLLKLSNGTAPPTFAQYFEPAGPPGPVLIFVLPYSGVAWSDQPVDATWASRPNAVTGYSFPDVEQPSYVPGFSGPISYWDTPPDQLVWYVHPYLASGVGVLFLHERFYTGQSVDPQRLNMQMAFDFLASDPAVDPTRIGIFGESWGGLEAVYGTLDAPASMTPVATVAWSAPIDFEALTSWINDDLAPACDAEQSRRLRSLLRSLFSPGLRVDRRRPGRRQRLVAIQRRLRPPEPQVAPADLS